MRDNVRYQLDTTGDSYRGDFLASSYPSPGILPDSRSSMPLQEIQGGTDPLSVLHTSSCSFFFFFQGHNSRPWIQEQTATESPYGARIKVRIWRNDGGHLHRCLPSSIAWPRLRSRANPRRVLRSHLRFRRDTCLHGNPPLFSTIHGHWHHRFMVLLRMWRAR
jgi:hypothetical protein